MPAPSTIASVRVMKRLAAGSEAPLASEADDARAHVTSQGSGLGCAVSRLGTPPNFLRGVAGGGRLAHRLGFHRRRGLHVPLPLGGTLARLPELRAGHGLRGKGVQSS